MRYIKTNTLFFHRLLLYSPTLTFLIWRESEVKAIDFFAWNDDDENPADTNLDTKR